MRLAAAALMLSLAMCICGLGGTAVSQEPDAARKEIKDIADRLCPLFLKNPQAFKAPDKKDWKQCDVTVGYGSRQHIEQFPCLSRTAKGSSGLFQLAIDRGSGGSCSSHGVSIIVDGKYKELETLNSGINGYGFGRDDTVVFSPAGEALVTNGTDLRLVTQTGTYVLCDTREILEGYKPKNPRNKKLCDKFAQDEFDWPKVIDIPTTSGNVDFLLREAPASESHAIEGVEADLDNNGLGEEVLIIQYASGAGCGCDLSALSIAKSEHEDSQITHDLNEKLDTLTAFDMAFCHEKDYWSPVKIDGKTYVARMAFKPSAPDSHLARHQGIGRRPFKDRVLYEYKNGDFSEVCRLEAINKKVIDKDVLPKEALDYTPLQ